MTRVFMTTAQKRKARAEADFIASLAPTGAKRAASTLPAFRRATPRQTLMGMSALGESSPQGRLHAPGCSRLDGIWATSRAATEQELSSHAGCSFCA
jgi:hypothetical protein